MLNKKTIKRITRIVLGWLLLILGILGLFLPVLQGILFITLGVLLLSPDVPVFKKLLQWLRERYPRIARKADRVAEKIEP
jgi:uncharacterized membrane protein YbaN (DUF454 family)